MNTHKLTRVIGSGFAGFLLILCATGILFFAFLTSLGNFLGFGPAHVTPFAWFLFIFVIPVLITFASALPVIALGADKKFSLVSGFVAFFFTVISEVVIQSLPYKLLAFIDYTYPLTLVIPVGVTTLSTYFFFFKRREWHIGILMGIWFVFSILGVVAAKFSHIAGFFVIMLDWITLPMAAAILQQRSSSHE